MEPQNVVPLVTSAREGNSEAFGQLYDLLAPKIYKFISFKVQQREQAEDILQDTFIKAWRGLATLRLEQLNFSAWLYRIARNTVNDRYRKLYRSPRAVELDQAMEVATGESPLAAAMTQSELEQVERASVRLPAHYRQVLELRFVQELSVTETAEVLGKSAMAVRLIQHRALKQLRNVLRHDYDTEYQKV